MSIREDLTGRRFGKLVVKGKRTDIQPEIKATLHTTWVCVCECGVERLTGTYQLVNGTLKSCGSCINESHGMSYSPEFHVHHNMKSRRLNANNSVYLHYGGRGITICDRWLNSFEAFYADMGPRPGPDYSIERRDVNGNYEPGNCH